MPKQQFKPIEKLYFIWMTYVKQSLSPRACASQYNCELSSLVIWKNHVTSIIAKAKKDTSALDPLPHELLAQAPKEYFEWWSHVAETPDYALPKTAAGPAVVADPIAVAVVANAGEHQPPLVDNDDFDLNIL